MRLAEAAAFDGVNFEAALEAYRATAEATLRRYFARNDFTFAVPTITVAKGGRKYAKLLRGENDPATGEPRPGGSVHSFVNKATGEIFKAASYSAPAKHARGNVYSDDHGAHALTDCASVRYLRG